MRSPLEIEVMLHHYYSNAPFRAPSQAADEAQRMLLAEDMLTELQAGDSTCATYGATERGRVYVDALMRLPFPTQRWVVESPKEGRE